MSNEERLLPSARIRAGMASGRACVRCLRRDETSRSTGEPAHRAVRIRGTALLGYPEARYAPGLGLDGQCSARTLLDRAGEGRGDLPHRSGRSPRPRQFHDHGLSRAVRRGLLALAGAAVVAFPLPAWAQTQFSPVCGVTGYATAPATITYDPFSPGGLSQVTIPLVLQRNRNLLGATREVSLILVAPAGSPALSITYQGNNVLYPEGGTAGRPRALNSQDFGLGAAGEVRYQFGNLLATDTSTPLNLRVSVPPGTDLSAGGSIYFDILYICSGDGLIAPVVFATRESRAVRLDVNTVSALQAYYAGSTLDFGEIGDVTTAQIQANPTQFTTSATNSLRVRSSGPYEVQVRSQNDFRLTFPGGNTANAAETIRYSVRFLGQDIASNAAFGTRTCARAGVAGAAGVLPIRAKLTEGGAGKTPSPNYADTVTITFTPLVTASAAQSCASL